MKFNLNLIFGVHRSHVVHLFLYTRTHVEKIMLRNNENRISKDENRT